VEGDVPHPVNLVFYGPVGSLVVVEVSGACEVGGQAGDAEGDLLPGPGSVEAAGVAARAEDLSRAGEEGVAGLGGADRAALGASVPTVVLGLGGLGPLGVGAGRQRPGGGAGQWLVPLQDQDVVGVEPVRDQAGGLLRGVQGIQGEHTAGQGESGQQGAGRRCRRACPEPASGRGPRRWRGRAPRPGRPAPIRCGRRSGPCRREPRRAAARPAPGVPRSAGRRGAVRAR
jgi:hypothetical protein